MHTPDSNRRTNFVLRALIDDMLERVRELTRNSSAWTDAERERAEAELEDVIARIRRMAGQGFPPEATSGS
jgi:hypothetical protein